MVLDAISKPTPLGTGYTEILGPYLRCAACLETPNIVPISDQLRWAWRAERTASVSCSSTPSRVSANPAIALSVSVSTSFNSAESMRSAQASRASARVCSSLVPPSLQQLGASGHHVDDRRSLLVGQYPYLKRLG